MPEKTINLSDSEWKLMNRLWERSPMTIMELTAAAKAETGWSKNTVITMLSRLENFLGKVYGGSLGMMMSAMVESRGLSQADIAELSAILKKAGGGGV